uniref:Uncharacterized protein n=1 Tax=Panagrolaimus superbus TaxID=310955 RepID=A0A914Z5U7_9BILA
MDIESGAKIMIYEEEKESLDARIAQVEYKCQQDIDRMKEALKEATQSREVMRLEKNEFEKQREAAMQQLAESNGHLNHSQKIHHLEKVKNEITVLKNENARLKSFMKAKGFQIPEKENQEPKMNTRW